MRGGGQMQSAGGPGWQAFRTGTWEEQERET